MGYKPTEEHRKKIGDAHRGKSSGMKGKHQSDKAKEKIRKFACKNKIWKRLQNLNEEQKNRKYSIERNKKISDAKKSEKNPNWKGNKALYRAKHVWIASHYGKANKCENDEEHRGLFVWANISGEYKRERNDFKMLCQSCHIKGHHAKINLKKVEKIKELYESGLKIKDIANKMQLDRHTISRYIKELIKSQSLGELRQTGGCTNILPVLFI